MVLEGQYHIQNLKIDFNISGQIINTDNKKFFITYMISFCHLCTIFKVAIFAKVEDFFLSLNMFGD